MRPLRRNGSLPVFLVAFVRKRDTFESMRKLALENEWSEWIANPRCESQGELERALIARREDVEVIAEIEDKDASYDYDDWALVLLDGAYYLLNTSGCSCPSPSETWQVMKGPATLSEIRQEIEAGDYSGYSVPGRQMDEFLAAFDAEAERVKT